jgi:hypothetical protein
MAKFWFDATAEQHHLILEQEHEYSRRFKVYQIP